MKSKTVLISVILVLILVAFSGCTQKSPPSNGTLDEKKNVSSGPKILVCGTSCPFSADKELSGAISELKGWFDPTKIRLPEWKAFKNPKGEGIIVIGSDSGAWCGTSNCDPKVYRVAYLVNTGKPQFEKVCPLNELSLISLDPRVTNNKVSYCENLEYDDISSFIE